MKKKIFCAILGAWVFALAGCRNAEKSSPTDALLPDYSGVYVDEDATDNLLTIVPDSVGGYHISIGIFRLASFDDGYGQPTAEGLPFTATDPAGQPIGGLISLHADTAVVTFTDSHWELLPSGEQFLYFRTTDKQRALSAIERFLTDSIGTQYLEAEVCIPTTDIVATETSAAGDTLRVWGAFWVSNYNVVADSLQLVSGGSHPGMFTLCKRGHTYEVLRFDQVADGSDFQPSARKIFGKYMHEFQTIYSNNQRRDSLIRLAASDVFANL